MNEALIALLTFAVPLALFFTVTPGFLFTTEFLGSELINQAKYAKEEPCFKDSSFLRKLAYSTIRLRIRQSPSGFHIEGNVFHFPMWWHLEKFDTNDEADAIVARVFILADQWLELDKNARVVGQFKS